MFLKYVASLVFFGKIKNLNLKTTNSHQNVGNVINTSWSRDVFITSLDHGKIPLTHWGRVTHICVGNLTIIGSDNGLSPERRQAIIWTNAGILLIGPLGTNFSEILIEIQTFSLKKIRLKMLSAKCSFRLGLNVLILTQMNWFYFYLFHILRCELGPGRDSPN